MASFYVVKTTLAAAVATNGTFTVGYPTGTTAGTFTGGSKHKLIALGAVRLSPAGFTVAFTSTITVTYKGSTTIPANTTVRLELDTVTEDRPLAPLPGVDSVGPVRFINLGSPAVGATNSVVTSQSISASTGLATGINGALASGGVATMDVPRNITALWTGTAVMSVTGTDQYGVTIHESSASGTALTGKKAFATVTAVSVGSDVTAAIVGTGNVLGLPVFLPEKGLVLREMEDGTTATAGTLVAAVTTTATATTGDVRGTYVANSTPDGAKSFQLVVAVPDPGYKGVTQF